MVPFYVGKLLGAISRAHGYVIAKDEGLVLALHDGLIEHSVLDEETETVVLGWQELAGVQVDHGRLKSTLSIGFRDAEAARELPGSDDGSMVVQVQPRYREELDELVERTRMFLAGRRDLDVDAILGDVNDFLDGI